MPMKTENKVIKTINNNAGSIDVISFKEFLKRIHVLKFSKELYLYNKCVGNSTSELDGYESTYMMAALVLSDSKKEGHLKAQLVSQIKVRYQYKRDLIEMIEQISIDSMAEYGSPNCLVRIAPRNWLLANTEDFNLIRGLSISGIACLYPNRNFLVSVTKATESEVLDSISKSDLINNIHFDIEEIKQNLRNQ